jgi:fibronectin type 3 domain-containing protein
MLRRHLPVLAVLVSLFSHEMVCFGEIIPAERLTAWEGNVGVPGGIPNRTTIYQTLNPDATASAIQNAINNCPSGQVVFLNEGTYNLGGSQIRIYNKNDWTLRGAGMGRTILTGSGTSIFTIGNVPWLQEWPAAHNITSGATRGSSSVTVADNTTGINVGELMVIEQPNTAETFGYGDGGGSTSATYPMDRMNNNTAVVNMRVMVTGISGTTVSFTPALPFTFWGSPRAIGYGGKSGPKNFGIEDLTLNGSTASGAKCVDLMGCYGAWFKNVEFRSFTKRGITPSWSARLEFRGCYIHEGAGGHDNGYSLECGAVNNCLFEDNIWYKCQASLFLQGGCMANVIAYNVVFHTWNQDSGTGWMAGGFVANHSPYPMYNLFEGNYVNSIQPDFYYGGSRYGTILRNYLSGTDVATDQHRQTVSIDSRQWDYNVVGNVLGAKTTPSSIFLAKPNITLNFARVGNINWTYGATNTDSYGYTENRIFRLGYPGIGSNGYSGTGDPPTAGSQLHALDLSVKPGHSHETIIHGNWDAANQAVTWHAGISDTNIPASLFRSSKPSYFGSLAWPAFDPYVPPASIAEALARIPAGYRLLNNTDPPPQTGGDTVAPSIPQNLASTAIGANQINLTWNAATDNVGVTGYRIERSQGSGSNAYSQVIVVPGASWSDAGLLGGTVYNYRVRAVDAAGNVSGYSGVTTATTGMAPDTTAPTVPTSLAASVVSTSQINITWTASTDAVGVAGYRVERSTGAGSTNYTQVAAPTGTSYNDTGLTAGTVYNYRVRAIDAAGNLSGNTAPIAATTSMSPDTVAPTVPTNLTAVATGLVNLNWSASTDAVGVVGYRVERSQGQDSTNFVQVGTSTGLSYADTGLAPSTVYNYRVRAADAAGNLSGYSPIASVTTPVVVVPAGLVAAYSFDEGSGAAIEDRSGSNNPGSINGAAWTTQGKFNAALSFNGVNAIAIVNASSTLNIATAMTLEAWVQPTAAQSSWRAILHRETDAYYLHASCPDGAMLPAGGGMLNGVERYVSGPAAIPVNTWTHLATTYDGTTLRQYVNGVEVSSRAVSGTIEVNAKPLRIGGNTYAGQFFQGLIDEVRIYNRALTGAEIQADMATPLANLPRPPRPPSGLRILGQ